MVSCRSIYRFTDRFRRTVAFVAMVAYLATAWGFPLPQLAQNVTAVQFPCQGNACGCPTADQCWKSCCCHTARERLDWARVHGVTIPSDARADLLAAAAREEAPRTCCAHDEPAEGCDASQPTKRDGATKSRLEICFVLGIEARKCRGLSTQWVTSGVSLPTAMAPTWEFDWAPVGRILPISEPFDGLAFAPPVPPPRA